MCGGNAEHPQDRRHRRVDSRRRVRDRRAGTAAQPDPAAADDLPAAVDAPPPVASPTGPSPTSSAVWQLRELRHQTPQHLTTVSLDYEFAAPEDNKNGVDTPQQERDDPSPRQPGSAATTTVATSVLIVGERYLVVGTDQGTVAVWDLAQVVGEASSATNVSAAELASRQGSPTTSTSASGGSDVPASSSLPLSSLLSPRVIDLLLGDRRGGPDAVTGRVVAMCPYPRDNRFDVAAEAASDCCSHVVAATEWGVVCVLDVARGEVLCRFETGRCSVTCVAAAAAAADPTTSPTLLVGYQTGCFECWIIRQIGSASASPAAAASGGATPPKPMKRFRAHLVARGFGESGCPIRSIAALPGPSRTVSEGVGVMTKDPTVTQDDVSPPINPTPSGDTAENDEVSKPPRLRASVTFESNRPVSASRAVSVVNVSSLISAFSDRSNVEDNSEVRAGELALRLDDHMVLPGTGREPVDWSLPFAARPPFPTQWVPSSGTNQVRTIQGIGVAFSSADGTVAVLREFDCPGGPDGWSWGIGDRSDQLLLSYPAIGIGSVQLPSPEKDVRAVSQHLVCCLRGGTVYLVPLDPDDTATNDDAESPVKPPRPLQVVTYPSDLDTDVGAVQQVQFFTAGNITTTSVDRTPRTVPFLVYAWPGGIIDVYACQLQTKTWSHQGLLQQLVENGSARLLQQLVLSSSADSSTRGPLWADAKEELLRGKVTVSHPEDSIVHASLTVNELERDELQAFRSLLLQMATLATISS